MTMGIYNEHNRGSDWRSDTEMVLVIVEVILTMVLEVMVQIILAG